MTHIEWDFSGKGIGRS